MDLSGKKVLVIDDSQDILTVIAEYLNLFGIEAHTAADGATGIHMAREHHPDLIICDVTMPGMDGYETLKALRQGDATATIPFIFLSGATDKINMRRGMELGADDYLTKPFTHNELMAAVQARLEKQAEVRRQSEKKLDELRGNISLALPHELRTPLNGIMGLAQILIDDYATLPKEEVLDTARYIYASALRLHRLIENFLVYSQIELMASESKRITIPPGAPPFAVESLLPTLARDIACRYRRDTDLQLAVAPAQVVLPSENFSKIIEELVDNAFKFSDPGQPVSVDAEVVRSRFQVSVTNPGRGMTAEQIARIGPHMQFDRRTYEQQGAGLGLVIAKRLTELLGGQFAVVSRPGHQTTARVAFPLPGR
ncbi:MAG: response regulator [Verrucomicrobia bacterium]|nr:response regulator [Verrucomicrobiota bacterium]